MGKPLKTTIIQILRNRKLFTPSALIYEDELIELESVIDIINKKVVETRIVGNKNMRMFRVTIHEKNKPLFISIMRDGHLNIRKR